MAWVVHPAEARGPEEPEITTILLPAATLGRPYEFTMEFKHGLPPFTWSLIGKGRLPAGLRLDRDSGTIHGTPEQAGYFPLTIRVVDDSYAASRDIVRWIVPFVVTAICLLGFVGMRRRNVYAFALLIAAQSGLGAAGILPISIMAIGWQALLWLVGVAHVGRMR